jgi:arylsulfatase A-like enzyme
MARILRANLNQPRRDSGIPHESASGAFGIRPLKEQGYATGQFGKNHLGGLE